MKKSVLLLVALLTWSATSVFAHDFEVDGIYYNLLGGDSIEVTYQGSSYSSYYNEYTGAVTIPETVDYNSTTYRVTTIGEYAFYGCSSLTAITIPNSITTIGERAFYDCSSLTAVTWNAKNCSIEGSSIVYGVFYCPITTFIFGNEVEVIPAHLCWGMNNLTTITIPNSVTTIGSSAFEECSSLTQTNYTGDIVSWCKIGFEDIGSNPTFYSHNLYINGQSITKVDIPEGVISISRCAFAGLTQLTDVTIPNSITTIGDRVFFDCSNLTAVTIGTGLDSLATYAFAGCNKLTKFICHSNKAVEAMEDEHYKNDSYIGEYAQEGAFVLTNKHLDTIVAPAQLFDLSEPAWSNLTKKAKYIQIIGGELTPDAFGVINRSYKVLETLDMAAATNTDIADEAFKGCYKLETLLLPSQLERIGYMAVADCKNLQAIDIPATVTDIDDSAFENCRSIQTLTFGGQQPASAPAFEETHHRRVSTASTSALQRIGNWAFYNCHELQHLEIPEGVTEIGAAAFYGCTYLEDLTLPASVQSIGDNCFALCSKLNKITCLATVPPTIEAKTFYDVKRSIPLYVPEASINDYANDTYWGEFINTQAAETPDGVDNILQEGTSSTRKVLENGTIYILRNGERYTIDGRKVE